ncbi:MAG: AbrB/MazE/SpoVT family DNA-binding domain-containing protein [Chloroflexota bacterium]
MRERRQITLPAELCERLGRRVGDRLEVRLEDDTLVVKPKKTLALRALREIQAAFAASGMTEEELQIVETPGVWQTPGVCPARTN